MDTADVIFQDKCQPHVVDVELSGTNYSFLWVIQDYKNYSLCPGSVIRSEFKLGNKVRSQWRIEYDFKESSRKVLRLLLVAGPENLFTTVSIYFLDRKFNKKHDSQKDYLFQKNSCLRFSDLPGEEEILTNMGDLVLYVEICILNDEMQFNPELVEDKDSRFAKDMGCLLKEGQYSDFSIEVEDRQFLCHRAVLSSRSPYFSTLLNSEMKEKRDNKLTISDVESSAFQQLLRYIYTGEVDISERNVLQLLVLADQYLLERLKKICEEKLHSYVSLQNASKVLVIADMFNLPTLKCRAMQTLGTFTNQIKEISGWATLTDYRQPGGEGSLDSADQVGISAVTHRESKIAANFQTHDLSKTSDLSQNILEENTFPPRVDVLSYTDTRVLVNTNFRVKSFPDFVRGKVKDLKYSHCFNDRRSRTKYEIQISTSDVSEYNNTNGQWENIKYLFVHILLHACEKPEKPVEFRCALIDSLGCETNAVAGTHVFDVGGKREAFKKRVLNFLDENNMLLCGGDLLLSIKCMDRQSFVYYPKRPAVPMCDLKTNIRTLQTDQTYADVIFRVDESEFPCHRAIMSCRSPFLAEQLKEHLEKDVIELNDIDSDTFKKILAYLHTDEYELNEANAWEVLPIACHFRLEHLKDRCESVLVSNLNVTNSLETAEYLKRYGMSGMQEINTRFLGEYFGDVFKFDDSNDFIKDYSLLSDVLEYRSKTSSSAYSAKN